MNNLINDSLKYLFRSDTFLRTAAVGGILTFIEQASLRAVLDLVAYQIDFVALGDGGVNASSLTGASTAVQGGLVAVTLVTFVVLNGYYVRVAERVISGEEMPPGFADRKRLVFDAVLFCTTLLAIVAVVLAIALAIRLALFVSRVVVEAYLDVPSLMTVLFVLWFVFGVIPLAIMLVYPQPAVWILIARFRQRSEPGPSYFRFVVSRTFIAELGSILLSRKYASSWVALIVVSILNGAATIQGGSIIAANQPLDLFIRLNTSFVSGVVGFYVSVAVVYIFATRFRNLDQYRQKTLLEF